MNLSVKEKIGQRCIIKENGQKLYDTIYGPLKRGENVTLDFHGVIQVTSLFFNFAIGQLLKDFQDGDLRRLLKNINLNETGQLVVERVMENSVKYHRDKDYRKIVDEILEQQASESN